MTTSAPSFAPGTLVRARGREWVVLPASAAELLAQGDVQRLAVLCSPALAVQWQRELRDKFAIDAELVLPSTATRLTRGLMLNESLFDRHRFVVVSTDFIKSPVRRHEFIN